MEQWVFLLELFVKSEFAYAVLFVSALAFIGYKATRIYEDMTKRNNAHQNYLEAMLNDVRSDARRRENKLMKQLDENTLQLMHITHTLGNISDRIESIDQSQRELWKELYRIKHGEQVINNNEGDEGNEHH